MPLSKGQKDQIQASIEHFFYGLEEQAQNEIINFIKELETIFNGNYTEGELTNFSNFFYDPKKYLKELHLYGNKDITIGEVRKFIIEFSDMKIKEATIKNDLNWDKNAVLNKVESLEDNKEKFAPQEHNIFYRIFNRIMDFFLDRNPSYTPQTNNARTNIRRIETNIKVGFARALEPDNKNYPHTARILQGANISPNR